MMLLQARKEKVYVNEIRRSNRLLWRSEERREHEVKRSDKVKKKRGEKWKHASVLDCAKHVVFVSGQVIASESPDIEKSKSL